MFAGLPRGARPLRWIKFAAGIAAGISALKTAGPAWAILSSALAAPFAEVAHPLRILPGMGVGLFVATAWALLVADAAFDRLAPRGLLAALVGVSLCASAAPGVFAVPAGTPARAALASALHDLRGEAACALVQGETAADLHTRLAPRLPQGIHVDRWLRRVPSSLVILEAHDGPVVTPRPGDPPGTVYLALAQEGAVGWISASGLEDGEVAILRDGGRPFVLGVAGCAERPLARKTPIRSNGGAPC